MKNFKFGDYVWYLGSGWQYIGMDEDGVIHICRPVKGHPFHIIEFEQIYLASESDELEQFYADNGECFTDACKRKGIKIPNETK